MRASVLNLQPSLSHMALTLLSNDLLDVFPNVTFQLVNLGGTLPFIAERMEAVAKSREMALATSTAALRRLVYDTASLGPRAIELAVRVVGADRIMFGTDYPIFPPPNLRELLAAADISDDDRSRIASGTATALLSRLRVGPASPAVPRLES